jgi:hypothetical protein
LRIDWDRLAYALRFPDLRAESTLSTIIRRNVMSKSQHSNREGKKQALLTPKEKKVAKRLKKHANDPAPLIVTDR